jgi:hypothetical protein
VRERVREMAARRERGGTRGERVGQAGCDAGAWAKKTLAPCAAAGCHNTLSPFPSPRTPRPSPNTLPLRTAQQRLGLGADDALAVGGVGQLGAHLGHTQVLGRRRLDLGGKGVAHLGDAALHLRAAGRRARVSDGKRRRRAARAAGLGAEGCARCSFPPLLSTAPQLPPPHPQAPHPPASAPGPSR